jgi:hypothetical protein
MVALSPSRFIRSWKNLRADILIVVVAKGSRGTETPVTPDGPDVLGDGDGGEGFGLDGLATGCRVRRVVRWLEGGNVD